MSKNINDRIIESIDTIEPSDTAKECMLSNIRRKAEAQAKSAENSERRPERRKTGWVKWAAAVACFAIIIFASALIANHNKPAAPVVPDSQANDDKTTDNSGTVDTKPDDRITGPVDSGSPAIGGSLTHHNDYDPIFEYYVRPCFHGIKFTQNPQTLINRRETEVEQIIDKYDENKDPEYRKNHCAYLWYVVHELGITREEVELYNEDLSGIEKLTEEDIDALMVEDRDEAYRLMRTKYTLYSDGEIYNVWEISEMTKDEFSSHDFPQEEIDRLIANLEEYPSTIGEGRYENREAAVAYYTELIDGFVAAIRSFE